MAKATEKIDEIINEIEKNISKKELNQDEVQKLLNEIDDKLIEIESGTEEEIASGRIGSIRERIVKIHKKEWGWDESKNFLENVKFRLKSLKGEIEGGGIHKVGDWIIKTEGEGYIWDNFSESGSTWSSRHGGERLKVMEEWKEINFKFTRNLKKQWEMHGFDYGQTKKWIEMGLKPEEVYFAKWLKNKENSHNSDINLSNIGVLRNEYQDELGKTIEKEGKEIREELINDIKGSSSSYLISWVVDLFASGGETDAEKFILFTTNNKFNDNFVMIIQKSQEDKYWVHGPISYQMTLGGEAKIRNRNEVKGGLISTANREKELSFPSLEEAERKARIMAEERKILENKIWEELVEVEGEIHESIEVSERIAKLQEDLIEARNELEVEKLAKQAAEKEANQLREKVEVEEESEELQNEPQEVVETNVEITDQKKIDDLVQQLKEKDDEIQQLKEKGEEAFGVLAKQVQGLTITNEKGGQMVLGDEVNRARDNWKLAVETGVAEGSKVFPVIGTAVGGLLGMGVGGVATAAHASLLMAGEFKDFLEGLTGARGDKEVIEFLKKLLVDKEKKIKELTEDNKGKEDQIKSLEDRIQKKDEEKESRIKELEKEKAENIKEIGRLEGEEQYLGRRIGELEAKVEAQKKLIAQIEVSKSVNN